MKIFKDEQNQCKFVIIQKHCISLWSNVDLSKFDKLSLDSDVSPKLTTWWKLLWDEAKLNFLVYLTNVSTLLQYTQVLHRILDGLLSLELETRISIMYIITINIIEIHCYWCWHHEKNEKM